MRSQSFESLKSVDIIKEKSVDKVTDLLFLFSTDSI